MKKFITPALLLGTILAYAQVGIGTETPEAMLDVAGDLRIQEETLLEAPLKLAYIEDEEVLEFDDSHIILVSDISDENIVKKLSLDNLRLALGLSSRNTTIYSASNDGAWSLLSLGIFGSGRVQGVDLSATDVEIGDASLFSNAKYTAPEDGIYSISFELQLEGGVDLSLLGGKSLVILQNNAIIKQKVFDAVRVSLLGVTLAQVPVTSTELSTLVELNEDDTLSFGVFTEGLLPIDLGLLEENKVSISIHKISDLLD